MSCSGSSLLAFSLALPVIPVRLQMSQVPQVQMNRMMPLLNRSRGMVGVMMSTSAHVGEHEESDSHCAVDDDGDGIFSLTRSPPTMLTMRGNS